MPRTVCGVGGDVFLSLPCVICREGVQQRLMPELESLSPPNRLFE